MSNKLLILADAVAACCAAASAVLALNEGNSFAASGWAMTIMWIFIDMTHRIFGLKKGGAE